MKSNHSHHAFLTALHIIFLTIFFPATTSASKETFKTSFDCTRAKTKVEIMICSDKHLADADCEMAALYKSLMAGMPEDEKSRLKREQRDWLKNRALCESSNAIIDCMKDAYDKRIANLKNRKEGLHNPAADDAASDNADIPFTIKKGELRVFGHVLTSKEISAKEDEYYVSFHESPDKRWVVTGYDEPFEKTLVWLYDRTSKAPPVPVKAKRAGKHFGVDWYGSSVFAVYFGGMGYKTSQLFSVSKDDAYIQIESMIDYDPTRDIYARFAFDNDSIFVIVGRAFHPGGDIIHRARGHPQADHGEERFLVKMDRENTDVTMMPIDNVRFGIDDIIITYEGPKGKIIDRYRSKIVENAR